LNVSAAAILSNRHRIFASSTTSASASRQHGITGIGNVKNIITRLTAVRRMLP
jgi:hypothetical protein